MALSEVEQRLRDLEAHQEVQESILIAMQAERIEAERLTESVDRLGLGASALGEALLQVDRNQQALTGLGRELAKVRDESVTKQDADLLLQVTKQGRRNLFWQMAAGLAFLLAMVGFVHLRFEMYKDEAAQICEARSAQSAKIGEYLDRALASPDIKQMPPERQAEVMARAKLLREAFPEISCEALR